ncbi:hypothetical protein P389DRAFT_177961 [Cystobasidium minutum MCA 4210]|uniref:uncharacterized protein n=1 Tax=Cystobasidium minutum MCA 4210 TaxID=1397322 RepID=UPI0034CDF7D9|eukprot:jgi/Rhomi1/177961/fgenesh1_pg.2_\
MDVRAAPSAGRDLHATSTKQVDSDLRRPSSIAATVEDHVTPHVDYLATEPVHTFLPHQAPSSLAQTARAALSSLALTNSFEQESHQQQHYTHVPSNTVTDYPQSTFNLVSPYYITTNTMISTSNPSSRSPSRTADRQSQSTTPGVLAVSSAMLANANQSQSGQSKASGKRSKSSSQRRSQNASSTNLLDPLSPAESPSVTSSKQEPTSALIAMMTSHAASGDGASSPASSPNKRTRSRRKAKPAPSGSEGDDTAGQSEDPAAGTQTPMSASKGSRPRQARGVSAINLAFTNASQQDDSGIDSQPGTPSHSHSDSLSKSAPASSFLETLPQTSKRRGKQQPPTNNTYKDATSSSKPPVRGSNSADEWEMPSSHLITGADTLTWQQQAALTRKSSQQGKKNPKTTEVTAFKKHQTPSTSHNGTPTTATAPSGLSNAMAAGAAKSTSSAQASPALTWQQALLQRSTPATPSANIFEALEDGYSGARPASDHYRTRSSPVKASRPFTRSQQQQQQQQQQKASGKTGLTDDEVVDLDKQLSDLVLSSVKPAKAAQPKSAKKAKPIPIQPSAFTQEERAHNSEPDVARVPSGTSPSVTKAIPLTATSSSPNKSALYAGPKFHNSPHAAALPTPKLAAFLNRNRESSPAAQSPSTTEAIFA